MKYKLRITSSPKGSEWLDFKRADSVFESYLCSIRIQEVQKSKILDDVISRKYRPYKMTLWDRIIIRFVWKGVAIQQIGSIGSEEVSGASVDLFRLDKKDGSEQLYAKFRNYRMGEVEEFALEEAQTIQTLAEYIGKE
jgi:hypothetical protein